VVRGQRLDLLVEALRVDPVLELRKLQENGNGFRQLGGSLRDFSLSFAGLPEQFQEGHVPRGRFDIFPQIVLGSCIVALLHRFVSQGFEGGFGSHKTAGFQMKLGREMPGCFVTRILIKQFFQERGRLGIIAGLDCRTSRV
jgi:hypothetical protein